MLGRPALAEGRMLAYAPLLHPQYRAIVSHFLCAIGSGCLVMNGRRASWIAPSFLVHKRCMRCECAMRAGGAFFQRTHGAMRPSSIVAYLIVAQCSRGLSGAPAGDCALIVSLSQLAGRFVADVFRHRFR